MTDSLPLGMPQLGVLLLGLLGLIILVMLVARARRPELPLYRRAELLSPAERSFYGVLLQATGDQWRVFPKVRVADALTPEKGLSRSDWQRAFNAISARHFDFLLCDPDDCSVKLAVELDDKSHEKKQARKRDRQLAAACESAGLPLLRIKAARAYSVADIRDQIQASLARPENDASKQGRVRLPGERIEPTL